MSSEVATSGAGFWSGDDPSASDADLLDALRHYRSADALAQQRMRDALGLGANAVQALRILIEADAQDRSVNAKELAERLGITAASTSALVDRLVRSGHVRREPDQSDRRGVLLTATSFARDRVTAVVAELEARTLAVTGTLPPGTAEVVVGFLHRMAEMAETSDALRGHPRAE